MSTVGTIWICNSVYAVLSKNPLCLDLRVLVLNFLVGSGADVKNYKFEAWLVVDVGDSRRGPFLEVGARRASRLVVSDIVDIVVSDIVDDSL